MTLNNAIKTDLCKNIIFTKYLQKINKKLTTF